MRKIIDQALDNIKELAFLSPTMGASVHLVALVYPPSYYVTYHGNVSTARWVSAAAVVTLLLWQLAMIAAPKSQPK